MDGLLYYGVLIVLGVFAFILYQNNSSKMALLVVFVGAYIIYSHNTGHTATEYKNNMVEYLNESAEDMSDRYKIEKFDEREKQNQVQ